MSVGHCICAALVALAGAVPIANAQQATAPPPLSNSSTSGFTIFLRGVPVGIEQISVIRTPDGWTILSTGRIGVPIDVTDSKQEIRYAADWKPIEFTIDATVRGQPQSIHTTFDGTTANNDITMAGQTTTKSDPIEAGAIVLPNALFSPYEALAARLKTAAPNSTLPEYTLPQTSLTLRVVDSVTEQIQTAVRLIVARPRHVTISTPNIPLDMNIWGDENGRLLRLTVPAQNIDVAREDIASVAARQVTISRPTDELVRILSNGFSLAGTLSKPAAASTTPHPAVILTGGSGATD